MLYISHNKTSKKNNENNTKTKRNKRSDISHILFNHHHSNNLKLHS